MPLVFVALVPGFSLRQSAVVCLVVALIQSVTDLYTWKYFAPKSVPSGDLAEHILTYTVVSTVVPLSNGVARYPFSVAYSSLVGTPVITGHPEQQYDVDGLVAGSHK